MARLLLLILIFFCIASLFFNPWVAGVAYVFNSLLQPQYLWPWAFEGVPIYKITAGLAILGTTFILAKEKGKSAVFREPQNFCLVAIWLLMHLSHFFSPFEGAIVSVSPEIVLSTMNSIVVMYFVLLPLCSNEKAIKYLCYTFIFVGLYYIYWSNIAYINEEWHKFSNNRLKGPLRSPYSDGNVLSVLIVMALPFISFMYLRFRNKWMKLSVIVIIPLAWHSIILFSSRGALLASVVTMALIAYLMNSKKLNLVLVASFFIFLLHQGATILERTTETIERAKFQEEEPINPRLVSWEVGFRLIPKYPVLGVGVQQFETASNSHFPGMSSHVAHNTFLNFSVNSGLFSGIFFLTIIFISLKRLIYCKKIRLDFDDASNYVLASSSIGIVGFFICSIFLDLIIFEPFYILMVLNLLSWRSVSQKNDKDKAINF